MSEKIYTANENKQIALEYKYNPNRARELLGDVCINFKKDDSVIWTSVYDVVYKMYSKTGFELDPVISHIDQLWKQEDWAEETTIKFLSKIMELDGKNTPIQSIVYANHGTHDKVQDALLSMTITEAIAKVSPVINIKIGSSLTGEDSVTVYPLLKMDNKLRAEIEGLFSGLPMLCKPVDWRNNWDGGYLTDRCKSNIILGGKLKEHSERLNYDAINYMQGVGYLVNTDFIECTVDEKEETWVEMPGGKKVKTGYVHNKEITKFYADANTPFYFVIRADNRTRTYPVGYNINPQGYDYQKASLVFSDQDDLTEVGFMWAKVAIAGLYGLDKEVFNNRLKWFDKNLAGYLVDGIITTKIEQLIEEAEEPHLFKATFMNLFHATC